MSCAIFIVVFATSSLNSLAPAALTRWLLRNRKYLGLSVALGMAVHAGFLLWLAAGHWDSFATTLTVTGVGGGAVGYVFLIAMSVTSFPGSKTRLGSRRWKILHKSGMYVLFAIFVATFGGHAAKQPATYGPLAALLILALGLRVAARLRRWALKKR